MKAILKFLFLILIILINYQFCNAQVVVTKNLTAGVNTLKSDGSNLSINFSLTLPPGTSSVTIELENSDTVNAVNPYTISFSTQTWAFPSLVGNAYNCTQNFGFNNTPITNTNYSGQILAALGQTFYSCPSSPTNKLGVKYTSTSVGNLAVYAIVNTNGINLTTPPINANINGNPITTANQNNGATFTQFKTLNSTSDPPLGVSLFATRGTPSGIAQNLSRTNLGSCGANDNCGGLYVSDSGYINNQGSFSVAIGITTFPLWTGTSGKGGVIQTCAFTTSGINTVGTTPTLDIYIQDSPDGATWNDRVHFPQITTGIIKQYVVGIAGSSVDKAITLLSNISLAPNTKVSGPLDAFGQVVFSVNGTASPQYAVTYSANCK